RYIAWGSKRSGNTNIWQMEIDGSNPKQISNGAGDYFPDFSPDGKWILYTAYDPVASFWSILKVSIEGGPPVKITDRESALSAVPPDGKCFACNYEVTPGTGYQIAIIPFVVASQCACSMCQVLLVVLFAGPRTAKP